MNSIKQYEDTAFQKDHSKANFQLISQHQYPLKKYTIIQKCELIKFSSFATELLTVFEIKDLRKKKVKIQVRLFYFTQDSFGGYSDFEQNFMKFKLVKCFFIELGLRMQLWSYKVKRIQLIRKIFQSDNYPPESLLSLDFSQNYIVAGGKSMYILKKGQEVKRNEKDNNWECCKIMCNNFMINSVYFSESQKQIVCKSQKFHCLFIIQEAPYWVIKWKIGFPSTAVEPFLASRLFFAGDQFLICLTKIIQWNRWNKKIIKTIQGDEGGLAVYNQLNKLIFYVYDYEIKVLKLTNNTQIEQQKIPFQKSNMMIGQQYSVSKDATHFIHFDKKFYIWKNKVK